MGGKGIKQNSEKGKCDHEWKAVGTRHGETFVELLCVKCGEKKEIYLFP